MRSPTALDLLISWSCSFPARNHVDFSLSGVFRALRNPEGKSEAVDRVVWVFSLGWSWTLIFHSFKVHWTLIRISFKPTSNAETALSGGRDAVKVTLAECISIVLIKVRLETNTVCIIKRWQGMFIIAKPPVINMDHKSYIWANYIRGVSDWKTSEEWEVRESVNVVSWE